MTDKKLRFAILARVSTVAQAQRGESLRHQVKVCTERVHVLGGVIPKAFGGIGGRYVSQEHSTLDEERKVLDRLIVDSGGEEWDGIILEHTDRLGRDNFKNKQFYNALRMNGNRFFTCTREFNLYSPSDRLQLGIEGEAAEFFGLMVAEKSIKNRMDRAARGLPSGGRYPFGRQFIWDNDRNGGHWEVDPDKAKMVKSVAAAFLKGESMETLARRNGMAINGLYRILQDHCGDHFTLKLKSRKFPDLKGDYRIECPRLLPDNVIEAVKARIAARRRQLKGHIKYKYLFKSILICEHCGRTFLGHTWPKPPYKKRYKHPYPADMRTKADRERAKTEPHCQAFGYIRAEVVEPPIMEAIFDTVGDKVKRQEAIFAAAGEPSEIRALQEQKATITKQMDAVKLKIKRLLDKVEAGVMKDDDIAQRMAEHKAAQGQLAAQMEKVEDQLAKIPTKEEIDSRVEVLEEQIRHSYLGTRKHFREMSFDDKKRLLDLLFVGAKVSDEGKKPGIYLKKTQWGISYLIRGIFKEPISDYLGKDAISNEITSRDKMQ